MELRSPKRELIPKNETKIPKRKKKAKFPKGKKRSKIKC